MDPQEPTTRPAPRREPLAWKLLLIPALAQVILHVATNGRFGIFRDEYYYLACAARPAFGYVDQPPLSMWLLGLWKSLFGDSVQSIRVIPALCGAGLIMMTGAIAAEMGGRRWAQLLAGLAAGVGGTALVVAGFFSMNALDMVVWAGAYLLVVRIALTGDGRWWPWLGLIVGIGLLNKIGLFVFGLALALSLAVTEHRRHLADRRLWLAGAIALAFALPYAFWNMAHGWPTLEFIHNARTYKIADLSPVQFLSQNVLEANPVTLPLWLAGLMWVFVARRARALRIVGLMFVLTFVILIVQKGKPYYLAASFPPLMAAGATAWEAWTEPRRWRWARWLLAANVVAGGVILAPIAVPILPPAGTADYQRRLGIETTAAEVGHTSTLPQHFSDRLGWEHLAEVVADVYAALPAEERARCAIVAENYGEAGALEYWSSRYDLPAVTSPHNSYWLWGPPRDADTFIVVGADPEDLGRYFAEVEPAAIARAEWAQESRIAVVVCRVPKGDIGDFWREVRNFI